MTRPHLLRQRERHHGLPRGNRDVLPSVKRIADRRRPYRTAHLKSPQYLARPRIERDQVPFRVAAKHEPTRRRKQSPARRADRCELPDRIAALRVQRQNPSASRTAAIYRARLVPLSLYEILLRLVERHAPFRRGEIVESGLRTVRCRLPVVAAAHPRTSHVPFLGRLLTGDQDRTTVRRDAVRP